MPTDKDRYDNMDLEKLKQMTRDNPRDDRVLSYRLMHTEHIVPTTHYGIRPGGNDDQSR